MWINIKFQEWRQGGTFILPYVYDDCKNARNENTPKDKLKFSPFRCIVEQKNRSSKCARFNQVP